MIAVTSATAGNWAEAEPRSVADFPALMMARARISVEIVAAACIRPE
jgi:hypothetical protein